MIRKWTVDIADNVMAYNWTYDFEEDRAAVTSRVTGEMIQYFKDYIRERYKAPRDDDLVSVMITTEADGDRFTPAEVESMALLLLLAGNDTTTNLISNFVMNMARFPDQAKLVREDPSLIPQALEETLRFTPSLLGMERFVAKETEIHGTKLKPGDTVAVWIGAANRDPRAFDRPDAFDITRKPNRHISFAYGPHMCLGAPLARMEGRIAATEIMRRSSGLELIGDPKLPGNSIINGAASQKIRVIA